MVKSGEDRAAKYAAKFDAEVVRSRFAATAEIAKSAQVTRQKRLEEVAAFVRNTLNNAGILPIQTATYLSFANKLVGIVNKFGSGAYGSAPHKQAMLAYTQWQSMGANEDILEAIFTYVLGSPPSPYTTYT